MERITKSKKLLTLVLSALMFALIITSVFVSGEIGGTVYAASSFDASCSVLYDIQSDNTGYDYVGIYYNNTGIKVETDLDASLAQDGEMGVEIGGKKYKATSPLLGGYYVVDIKGLKHSTNYTVKPYYKDSNGNYVYAASDFTFKTDDGYIIKTKDAYYNYYSGRDGYKVPTITWYTRKGATASFGHPSKQIYAPNIGWGICGFANNGVQVHTTERNRGWEITCSNQGTLDSSYVYKGCKPDLLTVKIRLLNNTVDVWRVNEISEDGSLVISKYYVRNISDSALSDFKFGTSAYLSVGPDYYNCAYPTITKTDYGIKARFSWGGGNYSENYYLALNEGYTDTPVDSVWFGGGDFYNYSSTDRAYTNLKYTFENTDRESGGPVIAYSWQGINLAPGETRVFSVSSAAIGEEDFVKQAMANITGTTLKNGEETTLDDGEGVTIKNTYTGSDGDHYVFLTESTDGTTVKVKQDGKVKIGDDEYVAGDEGATILVSDDGYTLTDGSVQIDDKGDSIIVSGQTVTNGGNVPIIVGTDGGGGGYFTIPSGGAVTFGDTIYKNDGTKDVTGTFDDTGKITLSVPNNGTVTIGDDKYNAGKKGATIVTDGDDETLTSGSVWLDIDQSIKIGNKEVTNGYGDTIIVNATDENGGYFTIPSDGTVTVGGTEIIASGDTDVVIDDKGTTITVPAGETVTIDGKEFVGDDNQETTVKIDNYGNISVVVKQGASATIDGKRYPLRRRPT